MHGPFCAHRELSKKGGCPVCWPPSFLLASLLPAGLCLLLLCLPPNTGSKHNNCQGDPGLRREELGKGPNVQKVWEP